MTKLLLWNDKETTNLDTSNPHVLEDFWELTDINAGVTLFEQEDLYPENLQYLDMDGYVGEMHTGSGLVEELKATSDIRFTTIEASERRILAKLDRFVGPDDTLFLAGSGIARFDQTIIQNLMKSLYERLYYAPVDVGVARRMYSFTGSLQLNTEYPFVEPDHRAKADVKQSQDIYRVLSSHMSTFEQ